MPQPPLRVSTHLSPKAIEQKYRKCTNARNKIRWQLIWIMTRPGKKILVTEAATLVGFCNNWARILVKRYNDGGEDALIDQRKNNVGREPILNAQQIEKLKKALKEEHPEDGGLWTGPKVAQWIGKETNQAITPQGAWIWLQKISFSPHVPRPAHTKSATPEEREAFKKNSENAMKSSRKTIRTKQ